MNETDILVRGIVAGVILTLPLVCLSQMAMYLSYVNYRCLTARQKVAAILDRAHNRERFFSLAVKMIGVCLDRGIRIVMENPWSMQTFLKNSFIAPPPALLTWTGARGVTSE